MSEDSAKAAECKPQNKPRKPRSGPKKPKKITQSYLHNAGLYYLQRFPSSAANFRAVMMRKIKRSCMVHPDQDLEQCAQMLENIVQSFTELGLLNDELYTRGIVTSLRRRGKSARAIQGYLRSKGLLADMIEKAMHDHDSETHNNAGEAELEAALTFARKKRIGPYRGTREADHQKELGRMARAGFSYDTSRRVLDKSDDESTFAES